MGNKKRAKGMKCRKMNLQKTKTKTSAKTQTKINTNTKMKKKAKAKTETETKLVYLTPPCTWGSWSSEARRRQL